MSEDRLSRIVRVALVAAPLLALVSLVAVASASERPEGGAGLDVSPLAGIRDVVLTLGVIAWALVVGAILWMLVRGSPSGRVPPGFGVVAALAVFTAIAWTMTMIAGPEIRETLKTALERLAGEEPLVTGEPGPASRAAERSGDTAEFHWPTAGVVLGVLAVAAAYMLYRRLRIGRAATPLEVSPVAEELSAVVEGTIDDLRREADPRRAVIAAYAQMERVLGKHGHPRRPSEAPFEYLARILRELRVRASAALALTELFERARFSAHVIDVAMKDEAIDALVAVRDDLRQAVA